MKILLRAEESEDRVALLEDAVPPACKGPPLHHHGWDEAFYVLARELTFQLADRVVTKRAGEVAFAPRGLTTRSPTSATPPPPISWCVHAGRIRALLRRGRPILGTRPPGEVCRGPAPRIAPAARRRGCLT
jgi:hypothetical protein